VSEPFSLSATSRVWKALETEGLLLADSRGISCCRGCVLSGLELSNYWFPFGFWGFDEELMVILFPGASLPLNESPWRTLERIFPAPLVGGLAPGIMESPSS